MTNETSRLENFPVSFFAMVMGLAGLTIAWEKSIAMLYLDLPLNIVLAALTGLVFLVLTAIYLSKIVQYRSAVVAELNHPVKLNFFPAISISLILLSITTLHINESLAHGLWVAGSALHLVFMLFVLNMWVHHEHFEIQHLNPAWFIPAVGNVLVPIAGTSLGYFQVSWFFFSIGILFWLILLTIIFNRMLFHHPLPVKLMPTLFILIAPPAVGFISYVKLTGGLDSFAHVLYYIGLFFTLFLFTQTGRFIKIPFFLSWWAYSFPLAAITVASWVMYEKTSVPGIQVIALVLLAVLTMVVLLLLIRTFRAVMNRQVCLPE